MLAVVVGRSKETKNRIEQESGAHIDLLPPSAKLDDDNWICRVMSCAGGHEEAAIAAKIIQDLIDNSEVCADLLCHMYVGNDMLINAMWQ